jgi:hypothetical protein
MQNDSGCEDQNAFVRDRVGRVFQCRTNIRSGESRIGVEEIVLGSSLRELAEQKRYGDTSSPNDWLALHNCGIDLDAVRHNQTLFNRSSLSNTILGLCSGCFMWLRLLLAIWRT